MTSRTLRAGTIAVGAAALVAVGYGFGIGHAGEARPPSVQTMAGPVSSDMPVTGTDTAAAASHMGLPDFTSIVSRYGPAVVNVQVSGVVKTSEQPSQLPQLSPNDPFSDFFRQFQQQMPQQRQSTPMHGLGSGFIVSPDGIILTNAHVVAGADEVTVKLIDKREYKARVLGVDKATDVAVLKIDAHNLPVVKLGDASKDKVGEWAVAIGAPFGFENTATAGIISAKSRSLPDQGYVQFIQTDVPVNPGNSGGPLFNLNGEVIGINSQIYSGTGGFEGVSFAIPINLAMQVEQQLVKTGHVERGQMGVSIQSVDQSLAAAFGLKDASGALISAVSPGGPGARAGLKPGDVILKFNGQPIADAADLPPLVANVKPGDSATLAIWRKDSMKDVSVRIGDAASASQTVASTDDDSGKARLGLAVRPLTPQERQQANVSDGGLLVEQASGPAAKAGIQPGDIVLALNGQSVSSAAQLRQLVGQDGHHLALLVQHDDAKIFVPIDLG